MLNRRIFCVFLGFFLNWLTLSSSQNTNFPFYNTSLSWDARVEDLVNRLSLQEIVDQMAFGGGASKKPTPAIPRLGIKEYNFDTECLRGIVNMPSTAYPQSIGFAASFSPDLLAEVASAISVEARAIFNNASKHGDYGDMKGISCFAPFINIVRHPLWGRIQEVYGEDPYLSGVLAASYSTGLQGDHPRYVRANSGCKVVDVHSGPENIPTPRFSFNAIVSERDMRLTYLPNFKTCIEAGTYNLMCSYNSINGVPACANKWLLQTILRDEFGFKGYYVSDEGAIEFIYQAHKYTKSYMEAAVAAAVAGVNLELPPSATPAYLLLEEAAEKGMISVDLLRERVKPLFYTRMRLGEFDPPDMNPYNEIGVSEIESPKHQELAIKSATMSYVLLKNDNQTLPLNFGIKSIAAVGPMANNLAELYGNYNPVIQSKYGTTPYDGLKYITDTVYLAPGCPDNFCKKYDRDSVVDAAVSADVVVVCLGTGTDVESEGNDRADMDLPGYQLQLLQDAAKYAGGVPVVLLVFSAGPLDISWAKNNPAVNSIIQCFFPAQGTGKALARVLWQKHPEFVSPAARMPYTWPLSLDQVPPMVNYSMEGRTYRYFKGPGEPLYPFGYGLSYTTFKYSDLDAPNIPANHMVKPGEDLVLYVNVANTGHFHGDEVVQVYIKWMNASVPMPQLQLVATLRVFIVAGQGAKLSMTVKSSQMQVWDDKKGFIWESGDMMVYVGGQQPNQATKVPSNVLSMKIHIDA